VAASMQNSIGQVSHGIKCSHHGLTRSCSRRNDPIHENWATTRASASSPLSHSDNRATSD
jgi:hypothetical protein